MDVEQVMKRISAVSKFALSPDSRYYRAEREAIDGGT